jgi:uncharacterized membrane protein YtjA (UPF0391 family)
MLGWAVTFLLLALLAAALGFGAVTTAALTISLGLAFVLLGLSLIALLAEATKDWR